MVDGDEICACGKGAFHHQLGKRRDNRGLDMTAAKHRLANGHEVRNRVLAIADELYGIRMQKPVRMQGGGAVLLGDYSQ
jgi:hypothetical protein